MTNDRKSANGCRFREAACSGLCSQPRTKEPPRGQTKGIMGGQFVYMVSSEMTLDAFKVLASEGYFQYLIDQNPQKFFESSF